jgi:hypothetical protein
LGGKDFSVGAPSCNATFTACTVTVSFLPLAPGLRQDALLAKDAAGNTQIVAMLRGIGSAPRLTLSPGVISTLAGTGVWGYVNSTNPATACFRNPQGIASDSAGNIYVADSVNMVIRKIDAVTGAVTTVAGNGTPGNSGDGGPALSATFNTPTDVAVDAAGNLYIADQGNGLIRKVDALSGLISTAAGGGKTSSGVDGLGDGLSATSAILLGPNNVALDGSGNIYIADSFHGLIRKVTAATGIITVVAGGGSGGGTDGWGDGGPASGAMLNNPNGISLDAAGNLYIADTSHNLVRVVNASSGIITVLAGTGSSGHSGDGGLAVNATLAGPTGMAVDAAGNVYVAEFGNSLIRQISAGSGLIGTLAGSSAGYAGDGGLSNAALLNQPTGVALGVDGSLYVADYSNNVVRKVTFVQPPLTFPSTSVGTASPIATIALFNTGNTNLSLSSITLSSGFSQKPSGGTDCSATVLAPGASCQIGVAFTPTAAGAITGSLKVVSNHLNQAAAVNTISLSGTATAGTPQATLSASSLTFASQNVGTVSAAQSVSLTNSGTGALAISSIWLSGASAGDFSMTTNCPPSLAASASCAVSITFQPQVAGTRTAILSFSDPAAGSPQTVALTGTGSGGPAVSLNPASVQFGNQAVGAKSATQSVIITNTGNSSLGIYGIALAGANGGDFSIASSTCAGSLNAAASCTISLAFLPAVPGARNATLVLTDSAGNSPQSVALAGTGVAPSLSVSPATISLGSVVLGTKSAAQTVTLSNTSTVSALINGVALAGVNSPDFSIAANTCASTLAAGASCSVSLVFAPGDLGARAAVLTFTDSAGNSPQSVALSGTGVTPSLSVAPTALSFGSQLVGTKSTVQSVILGNSSGISVLISGIALAGVNATDFSITANTCGSTLATGSNCGVSIVFAPGAVGSRAASLTITDNASGSPQSVTLSGSGATAGQVQASFQRFDTATQGTWKGTYGGDGYLIANGNASSPSYATVGVSGGNLYTWVASTSSLPALQKPDPATDRLAAAYYTNSTLTYDVNLTDGRFHQLALYFLDWDTNGRIEKISIMDAGSGALLDSQTIANFHSGTYAVWNMQGHVLVQLSYAAGPNAVVSGLFFAPAALPPTVTMTSPSAGVVSGNVTVSASASAPAGIASVQFQLDGVNLNAALSGSGPSYSTIWAAGSTSAGSHSLTAVATDSLGQKTVSAPVTVTVSGSAAATFVKFDSATSGSWRGVYGQDGFIIANDSNVLPSYAAAAAVNLASLFTWSQSTPDTRALQKGANAGDRIASAFYSATSFVADINLTDGQTHQVALYCLDVDGDNRLETLTVRDASSGAVLDSENVSSFHNGVYAVWNLRGHVSIQISNTGPRNAVLSGIFFATTGGSPTVVITAPASGSVSGVVTVSASVSSIPAIASVQFQLDGVNLGAAVTGSGPSFSTQWDTTTASTGTHLLTAVASDTSGQKTVSAAVSVSVGTAASQAVSFIKLDTLTQGNWKWVYGQKGYLIANDSNSPGSAAISTGSASLYTWSPSSTDIRSLLKGASSTDRIASTFYSSSSFTFDVNLTDGQSHVIALYCLDLDTTTRNQQISILDPATLAVLDSRNIVNFHNGVYAVWNISGHVLIQVAKISGINAVVSGLFF